MRWSGRNALRSSSGALDLKVVKPPILPVLRFEPAIDAHGGDIAVGAGEGAMARRREGMGESGLGDEPRGSAQDAAGLRLINGEPRISIVVAVRDDKKHGGV